MLTNSTTTANCNFRSTRWSHRPPQPPFFQAFFLCPRKPSQLILKQFLDDTTIFPSPSTHQRHSSVLSPKVTFYVHFSLPHTKLWKAWKETFPSHASMAARSSVFSFVLSTCHHLFLAPLHTMASFHIIMHQQHQIWGKGLPFPLRYACFSNEELGYEIHVVTVYSRSWHHGLRWWWHCIWFSLWIWGFPQMKW